jgi:hypothetical protein
MHHVITHIQEEVENGEDTFEHSQVLRELLIAPHDITKAAK